VVALACTVAEAAPDRACSAQMGLQRRYQDQRGLEAQLKLCVVFALELLQQNLASAAVLQNPEADPIAAAAVAFAWSEEPSPLKSHLQSFEESLL
jgi:hypothetical protein